MAWPAEIAILLPDGPTKSEAYFERALVVGRAQQSKSWELRAAMSMARLWRDNGKVQQARELPGRSMGGLRKDSTRLT